MWEATKDYDENKGKFSTYAYNGIRWQILRKIREDKQEKIMALDLLTMASGLASSDDYLPVADVRESFPDLSGDEDCLLDLYLQGYTSEEVKKKMGLNIKKFTKLVDSLRSKMTV